MGNGFLDIHVLTCLQGENGNERMPVIRCRSADSVNAGAFENAPEVLHKGWRPPLFLLDTRDLRRLILIGIADIQHLRIIAAREL